MRYNCNARLSLKFCSGRLLIILYQLESWARVLAWPLSLTLTQKRLPSVIPMSSTTDPTSNLQSILTAALDKYTAQTGKDLQNDPLATEIRLCESPDDILHVFQAKAREFDEFRNDNSKLMKYLNPIVDCLDALSNNAALSAGVSLVSSSVLHRGISTLIDYPLGLSTRTNNILRD
jgi:hypothetical protein